MPVYRYSAAPKSKKLVSTAWADTSAADAEDDPEFRGAILKFQSIKSVQKKKCNRVRISDLPTREIFFFISEQKKYLVICNS